MRKSGKQTPITYYSLSIGEPLTPKQQQETREAMQGSDNPALLHFALANTYRATGDPQKEIEEVMLGNTVQGNRADIVRIRNKVDRIRGVFTRQWFQNAPTGNRSTKPVFIIGMPRSGTSLLEKILEAHRSESGGKDVQAIGEPLLAQIARELCIEHTNKPYPECMNHISPELLTKIADAFLKNLQSYISPDKQEVIQRIVSKYPIDFMEVGHLATLFPHAKFLHIQRNPEDTAASILRKYFVCEPYSNDPSNLGMYYQYCYRELMNHWRQALPKERMRDVSYEFLVQQPRQEIPAILNFLGLNNSPSCLEHHKHTNYSETDERAPKKIDTTSIGKGEKFGSYLDPFREHIK